MELLRMLDEWLVLLDASLWLQMHAAPVVWLFALGVALMAVLLVRDVSAAARNAARAATPASEARGPVRRRAASAIPPGLVVLGARGPRAPGLRMLRLTPAH